jgi:hypothetical protein
MGPPEPDDTGPIPAHRPPSVVSTSRSSPMVGHQPTTCPGRTCGDLGAPAPPVFPANRPARARDQVPLVGQAASAAPRPVRMRKRRPRAGVDPRASHALPTFDHPFAARPIRAATTKPLTDYSDTSSPVHQTWPIPAAPTPPRIQRGADSAAAAAADTGRVSVRTPGLHRTHGHRTHGHRTSARPVGRTSARRTADADRATNGEPAVRTSPTATTTATAGWAAQTSLGLPPLRRSATHDGSAVTTPAAAVTGSCATPLDMKPRLGALLSYVGFGWYEGRAMGRRKGEWVQVRLVSVPRQDS